MYFQIVSYKREFFIYIYSDKSSETISLTEIVLTGALKLKRSNTVFNLENICYFPSGSGGTISLHHSFTPSLSVRYLEIREELSY